MTGDRVYQVRVTGLLSPSVLSSLGDVEVATQELRTVLSGHFPDQAALYGFVNRLRALGLDVVEVRQIASVESPDEEQLGAEDPARLPEPPEER